MGSFDTKQTDTPGKILAVFSYMTIIGFIVCYFMNRDYNRDFARWHIKNMFGLMVMFLISYVFSTQEALFIPGAIFFYASTIFWLFSVIMCLLNKQFGIPWLSDQFQKWFTFLD